MAKMGRPRAFDRDEAIQQAMHLFWEYGYESTSLALLKENIGGGITAPSFYAAFGSKEKLFQEVVERYTTTYGQVNLSLWDQHLSPRDAIELALRRSAKMQTEETHPRGCFIVIAANTCSPEHQHVQNLLAEQRALIRAGFEQCIQRAVDSGEFVSETKVEAFAAVFNGFLQGITVLARDGMSYQILNDAITEIMRNWEKHTIR
ncbi:TetR/AcrR family transcriptional regulator [Acinetobacter sp.]|jgi:AcrR family transcriptional regulator|uniref:TetR/AcrR family transcriptional regulator n=1 Tax=Acinetobacter sp. TaxID=472 RepID=UPI00282DCF01|nr:TetR/AcrR family transcriptional regulator [Acinetobacter sp.]MDR0237085.1 TetR/AcrR family transcriptional regulator [Acinetobacter sp.]